MYSDHVFDIKYVMKMETVMRLDYGTMGRYTAEYERYNTWCLDQEPRSRGEGHEIVHACRKYSELL